MKKKSPQINKPIPEFDSGHETRVLLEDMRQGIRIIGEQHGAIVKRLDNIESELGSVKAAVMDNSLQIKAIRSEQKEMKAEQQRMGTEQQRMGTEQQRMAAEQQRMGTEQQRTNTELQEIKHKLDTVIVDHEQRLQKLEAIR
jgi:chromosome segregation ATPase